MAVLWALKFLVGRDAAAAVHGASAVGHADFLVGIVLFFVARVIVVVERNSVVVALNQAAARRVVLGGSESEPGVFAQRIHRLHQPFAKRDLAEDQSAV